MKKTNKSSIHSQVAKKEARSIPSQVATEARYRPTPNILIRREKAASALISKLQTNHPDFISLKLLRHPTSYFNDFVDFLRAIEVNKVIESVEFSWIFIAALSENQRMILLENVGRLPRLIKLQFEGIGPSAALLAALRGCRTNLQVLRIGSLRISNQEDVNQLADEFRQNQSLRGLILTNIHVKVEGQYRLDHEGAVWFEEIIQENTTSESHCHLSIDPLLNSMALIPTLIEIHLQLQLDSQKIARIEDETIQALCRAPRKCLLLQACDLDDQHCSAMCHSMSLEEENVLEIVSLALNSKITTQGWETIVKLLEKNYRLQKFYTCAGDPGGSHRDWEEENIPVRTKMDYYLKLNRMGRQNLLSEDDREWIEFMLPGKNDADVVFYTLRMKPSLCQIFHNIV